MTSQVYKIFTFGKILNPEVYKPYRAESIRKTVKNKIDYNCIVSNNDDFYFGFIAGHGVNYSRANGWASSKMFYLRFGSTISCENDREYDKTGAQKVLIKKINQLKEELK